METSWNQLLNTFGTMLKLDEYTLLPDRAKGAKVCLEIDLSSSLKKGFWVGNDDGRVFVVMLCKKLPTFGYNCGLVRHSTNSCCHRYESSLGKEPQGRHSVSQDCHPLEVHHCLNSPDPGMAVDMDPSGQTSQLDQNDEDHRGYGSWLLVAHRRNCDRGQDGVPVTNSKWMKHVTLEGSNQRYVGSRALSNGTRGRGGVRG